MAETGDRYRHMVEVLGCKEDSRQTTEDGGREYLHITFECGCTYTKNLGTDREVVGLCQRHLKSPGDSNGGLR